MKDEKIFELYNIEKKKAEKEYIERNNELNRQKVLYVICYKGIIEKPITIIKFMFFYYIYQNYFCPKCKTKLHKKRSNLTQFIDIPLHYTCTNPECDYEYIG